VPADLPESEFRNEYSSSEGKCQWKPCKSREEIAMEIQHLPNAVPLASLPKLAAAMVW
jgi:hypothetical protein